MPRETTTRERILQTAQELFTSKGFANASVSEICQRADVSPPTLYHHFGSKDGLFQEVVEETLSIDGFVELLQEVVMGPGTADEKLEAYVRTYLGAFPSEFLNPGLHLQDSTEVNGTSRRMVEGGLGKIHGLTEKLLREGIALGAFRDMDVETGAACLMGTVDSFVRARVLLGVEYALGDVVDCLTQLYRGDLGAGEAVARS